MRAGRSCPIDIATCRFLGQDPTRNFRRNGIKPSPALWGIRATSTSQLLTQTFLTPCPKSP